MNRLTKSVVIKVFVLSSILFLTEPILYIESVTAQNVLQRVWRRFTRRADSNGRPSSVGKGGANRDRCPYSEEELTAIVPVSETTGFPYMEKTISEYPTWYFYVPYSPRIGRQLEFVLIDIDENILYQEKFPLAGTPGLIRFTLPRSVPALMTNQSYRWVFSVICTQENRSGDATVNGWIQKVEQSRIISDLESQSRRDRYRYYLDNFLWFEAIDELIQAKSESPNDSSLEENWNILRELVSVEELPSNFISIEHLEADD